MNLQLNESMELRNYRKALSMFSSLSVLNRTEGIESEYDLQGIRVEYIKNLLEFEKTGAAAGMLSLGFINPVDLSNDDLKYFENRFLRGENKKALSLVVMELEKRDIKPREGSKEFLQQSVRMEDLLEGDCYSLG